MPDMLSHLRRVVGDAHRGGLAERCGVARQTLNHWLSGRRKLPTWALSIILDAVNATDADRLSISKAHVVSGMGVETPAVPQRVRSRASEEHAAPGGAA